MNIYLITHAQTQMDRDTDVRQWKLSAVGERQAEALARQPFWDTVTCIVHSSEEKTRLTVEPVITQRGLPTWTEGRFDELRRPGWSENYVEQVAEAFAHPERSSGDWEPAREALDRFRDGMTLLRKRFVSETVAVVGHGLTFSLYRARLLGHPQPRLEEWKKLSFVSVAQVNLLTERLIQDFEPVAGYAPRG